MKIEVEKLRELVFVLSMIQLVTTLTFMPSREAISQNLPSVLILTGNGNIPEHKREYPPWIHDFQNDLVVEILKKTVKADVTEDLSILRPDRLAQYDLIISNSLFLTPNKEQLQALQDFVAEGKSYLTLHCGLLSLLNWHEYERFIGGIFIGGPSSVPHRFKVVTENVEFWGYKYPFRKSSDHPVSKVVDDFVIKDELYHFQPSIPDFHALARAENLPVMWWHPVGKGKVMSLTLGHDEEAKNNPGYQQLLINGVRWLTGIPLIQAVSPKPFSNRRASYRNAISLNAVTPSGDLESLTFWIEKNTNPELYKVSATDSGIVDIILSGKPGKGKISVGAKTKNEFSSTKNFDITILEDGSGNIASYFGNTAMSSSNENDSDVFDARNVLDGDSSTRWSSAPTDTAWIVIDLQKNYNIAGIVLEWESSFASRYSVLGSENGRHWKTLYETSGSDGKTDELKINRVPARYIKILGTERANKKWGYSLYEVRVFQE
jgi:type 1 glutamine amidotransferase